VRSCFPSFDVTIKRIPLKVIRPSGVAREQMRFCVK
jgi:hypothetical protein